jgi:tRNA 2-selenouridine synthase
MSLRRVEAGEAMAGLSGFGAVIDARSEAEFAEDHLPGAVNWPSLNDAERQTIGTEYKQVSPFEARKRGAVLVARNIANHIEREVVGLGREWRPLVYCWRGGQRSGALATVLDQIGFSVSVLEGGYRSFRRAVIDEIETRPTLLDLRVVCGRTGTGKSRLLQSLSARGEQVLDLEGLACHRGSVLGLMPGVQQPSQKAFETGLWRALRGFDLRRPVFTEGESRTIGRLRVPEPLLECIRGAPVVHVEMPIESRVDLLLADYAHFVQDVEAFCVRLAALREVRGAATVERWQALARAGELPAVVKELLVEHYDPTYQRSMRKNFSQFDRAMSLEMADGGARSLDSAASSLLGLQELRPVPAPCKRSE